MKDIRFRAWHKYDKKMFLWDNPTDLKGVCWWRFRSVDSPQFVWMQYTGVNDINGKGIYEGDVVDTWPYHKHQDNCGGDKRFQKIIFSEGCFMAEHNSFGWEGEKIILLVNCSVIGNIYEMDKH
jgi:uncharacterized phage protein (TIGR01671 family)